MQYATIHSFVVLLLIVFSCTIGCAAQKRDSDGHENMVLKNKRPFCNAFTGCGRKRSEPPTSNMNDLETDLLLDKLSHQILGLVHVLEALHMRIESSRQNQQPLAVIEVFNVIFLSYLYDKIKTNFRPTQEFLATLWTGNDVQQKYNQHNQPRF